MKLLLDYDSTIADTTSHRLASINEKFGTSYCTSGVTTWHNGDSGYMDESYDGWSWGPECFLSPDWQLEIPPVEGAIEGIHRLLREGHEGMVVSDRPLSLFECTREWLDRVGLDTVRLLFTKHKASKSGDHKGFTKSQAAYLYKLTTVIEDAPHHSQQLAERSYIEKIFLLDTPYNQGIAHGKIVRVKGWNEIHI